MGCIGKQERDVYVVALWGFLLQPGFYVEPNMLLRAA